MSKPILGEIRSSRDLMRPGTHKYIWQACPDCGAERWIEMKHGRPSSIRCYACYGKSTSISFRRLDIPKETEVHYGNYGVFLEEGDRVQCHICGKWYILLATHLWKTHNYLADEYREQFGLGYTTGLLTGELSDYKSDITTRLIKAGIMRDPRTLDWKAARDAGSARTRGRKKRAEQIIKNLASHPRKLWLLSKCIICGTDFSCWKSELGKIKTCSKSSCHRKALSLALKGRGFTTEHKARLSEVAKAQYRNGRQPSNIKPRPCSVCGKLMPKPKPRRTCSPECLHSALAKQRPLKVFNLNEVTL